MTDIQIIIISPVIAILLFFGYFEIRIFIEKIRFRWLSFKIKRLAKRKFKNAPEKYKALMGAAQLLKNKHKKT